MWTIVIFTDENLVEVVPTSWVLPNNIFCYWPKDEEKMSQKITSCESPEEDKWTICKIRFPGGRMKTFDNILKARQACQTAEDYSSFSDASEVDSLKRRKKKMILYSSSEEENDDRISLAMPKYSDEPRLKKKCSEEQLNKDYGGATKLSSNVFLSSRLLNDNEPTQIKDLSKNGTSNRDSSKSSPSLMTLINPKISNIQDQNNKDAENLSGRQVTPNKTNALLHTIFREISKVNVRLDIVQQDISKILQRNDMQCKEEITFLKLPIENNEAILDLENKLKIVETHNKFVNFVKLIGGDHKSESVTRAMNRIMTNKVACTYSFKGKKGKKAFENLKVCEGIIEGVMHNSNLNTTKKQIEIEIQNWLRHAPERVARELKVAAKAHVIDGD